MSRIEELIDILSKEFPEAGAALKYKDPLQLLVATIQSFSRIF